MKKCLFILPLVIFTLVGCNQKNPATTGYSIDENNNVIINYDNGNQENVGNLTGLITSITISQDGYFVINDIETTTKVKFYYVAISDNGCYIINGIKTTIKATEVYTVNLILDILLQSLIKRFLKDIELKDLSWTELDMSLMDGSAMEKSGDLIPMSFQMI